MPRSPRRSIPPVLDDPRARALTPEQERTLLLLPLAVDDHGRALDDPGTLNGVLWGARWAEHPPQDLDAELDVLAASHVISRYEIDGVRYLQVLDWADQQVVSRPMPSRYPPSPHGARSRRGAGDAMWGTVEGLVNVVAGAAEKLHDPAVQAQGVRLLSDLAGQIDPALARRVRDRAGSWVGTSRGASPESPWPPDSPPPGAEAGAAAEAAADAGPATKGAAGPATEPGAEAATEPAEGAATEAAAGPATPEPPQAAGDEESAGSGS